MSETLLPRNKLLCHIFPHGKYKRQKKYVGLTDLDIIVKLKTQTSFSDI